MTLAIRELERRKDLDAQAIDEFIAAHTVPIQEGPSTTFLFRGDADAVHLQHWIYALPSSQHFTRIEGTDLWYLIVELPRSSRVEYKIDVVRGGRRHWIRDPFNPALAHDPFGANSVCQCPGYEKPVWTDPDPEARPGTLDDHYFFSSAFGDRRRVTIYRPARYRKSRRYPLLIVHDGGDYLKFASLQTVLDNLIHQLEIPAMIVALTHPHERLIEYPDNPLHAKYIAEELLPSLEKRLPIDKQVSARGLMGASFGGVASLSAAWRYPGLFGRLCLQSGSFAFTDIGSHDRGPAFDPVVRFVNQFRDSPGRPAERVYLSCGMYESLIYENRSLLPLLQETGMELKYTEVRDGHNWENWRDRLREGLSFLFPGPLWMVYE